MPAVEAGSSAAGVNAKAPHRGAFAVRRAMAAYFLV
jgi:hypothetical protein